MIQHVSKKLQQSSRPAVTRSCLMTINRPLPHRTNFEPAHRKIGNRSGHSNGDHLSINRHIPPHKSINPHQHHKPLLLSNNIAFAQRAVHMGVPFAIKKWQQSRNSKQMLNASNSLMMPEINPTRAKSNSTSVLQSVARNGSGNTKVLQNQFSPSPRLHLNLKGTLSAQYQLVHWNCRASFCSPGGSLSDEFIGDQKRKTLSLKERKILREKRRQERLGTEILMPEYCTPKILSNLLEVRAVDVLKVMIRSGEHPESATQYIAPDLSDFIVTELGFRPTRKKSDLDVRPRNLLSFEEMVAKNMPEKQLVLTVLGHVNHGKTTLLDYFRRMNQQKTFAESETGGITQKIASFEALMPSGNRFTFLDTPGHEAFNNMRYHCAMTTDIALLLVAADDGIETQTREAFEIIREAELPFIVVVTKSDKSTSYDIDLLLSSVYKDLGVSLEKFGGDVPHIAVSVLENENLADLEDSILLMKEELDPRCDPSGLAEGIVVESTTHKGFGAVATLMIRCGTLKVGDWFVSGQVYGRVRKIMNYEGVSIPTAIPGQPIEILGFKERPQPGEELLVVESEKRAKEAVEYRERSASFDAFIKAQEKDRLERAGEEVEEEEEELSEKDVPIIVKADSSSSLQALLQQLEEKIPQSELKTKIISAKVGEISPVDIRTAIDSHACLLSYGKKINQGLFNMAKTDNVPIFHHKVIYTLLDQCMEHLRSKLTPQIEMQVLARAQVNQVFEVTVRKKEVSTIAGCTVKQGTVRRGGTVLVLRGDEENEVFRGVISSLKHFKQDVDHIDQGQDCGIEIKDFNTFEEGDIIEFYSEKEKPRDFGQPLFVKKGYSKKVDK